LIMPLASGEEATCYTSAAVTNDSIAMAPGSATAGHATLCGMFWRSLMVYAS
jgi:hypothetical protein